MRRTLTVAPPPEVTWTTPGVPGQPVGGMSTQALLAWRAHIPDIVSSSNGVGRDYIKSVEIRIDGQPWATYDYDRISWYKPDERWNREVSFSSLWDEMTPVATWAGSSPPPAGGRWPRSTERSS